MHFCKGDVLCTSVKALCCRLDVELLYLTAGVIFCCMSCSLFRYLFEFVPVPCACCKGVRFTTSFAVLCWALVSPEPLALKDALAALLKSTLKDALKDALLLGRFFQQRIDTRNHRLLLLNGLLLLLVLVNQLLQLLLHVCNCVQLRAHLNL